jgi:gamma-glutamylcyclotransferase (GGCT)/AIG2-like uncharacterized protein YtfP
MNLFVYGTLLFPEILKKVTGQAFRRSFAVLRGYAEFMVRGETFSGLIPFPDRSMEGVIYHDVDAAAFRRIDAFEGDLFVRKEVTVETEDGEWVEAEAYCIRPRQRKRLTTRAWDEDVFRDKHLKRVLEALDQVYAQPSA